MTENKDEVIKALKERIIRLEEENKKWMRLAGINRLTQLPNSLMLFQVILPQNVSKEVPFSCILLCPDNLGEINQKHGRIIGDGLIKQIGDFLKGIIEQEEQLFHCDGANFAILLPEADEGHAKRRATLIKNQFRESTFSVNDVKITHLTCSAGVAEIGSKIEKSDISEHVEKLYNDLSNRLYQSKEKGGNYVMGASRL